MIINKISVSRAFGAKKQANKSLSNFKTPDSISIKPISNLYSKNYYLNNISFTSNLELLKNLEDEIKNGNYEEAKKMFYKLPAEIQDNVKGVVEIFKDEGLTLDNYLPACAKHYRLFYRTPEKTQNNVKSLVEKFNDNGLTLKGYVRACIKDPSLFTRSPETIEDNVKGLVEKFNDNGLTLDDYITVCARKPQLFSQNPSKTEHNVKSLVDKYKNSGLTLDKYIATCVKRPSLFTMSSDTVSEHINLIRFSKFNNNEEIDTQDFWDSLLKNTTGLTNSNSAILIKHLIIPKMFENSSIPKELKGTGLKQKLTDYLINNPDKTFNLNLKQFKTDTDCIELLREYIESLSKEVGRENIFNINIFE